MANKMISDEELRDSFLSALISSDEPLKAPPGFSDEIMNRIGPVREQVKLKPYNPPAWLRWGIPGAGLLCLIGLLISGPVNEPAVQEPVVSLFKKMSLAINTLFSNLNMDVSFPNFNISETIIWVLGGVIVLTWSFLLMFRFLEKNSRRDG